MSDKLSNEEKVARASAHQSATKELRDRHRGEFNDLKARYCADLGFEWRPRLTQEDRAARDLRRLIQEYPDLVSKMTEVEDPSGDEDDDDEDESEDEDDE